MLTAASGEGKQYQLPLHVDEVGEHREYKDVISTLMAQLLQVWHPRVTSVGKATGNALFEIRSLSEPRIDPLARLAG